jgi:rubrerythrin
VTVENLMTALPIKGTRTEKNLAASFARESMSRNRYTYYAKAAAKHGYERVAALFQETAESNLQIGAKFLDLTRCDQTPISVRMDICAPAKGSTSDNLRAAAKNEEEEATTLYPHYAEVAYEEGHEDVSKFYQRAVEISKEHQARFLLLARQIDTGTMFKRTVPVRWRCRNCGYVSETIEAPRECPACGHKQSFYEQADALE